MIDEESKYFCFSGEILNGGPSTWHVTDWDQRRVVAVTLDGEQEDDNVAIEHYSRLSNQLARNVHRVDVSDTGEIISTYTDLKNNHNLCVQYPPFSNISVPPGILTARRNELEELDRPGPLVDLVSYLPCSGVSGTKVL
jgi:hypothetical protein